jgi:ferrochelatase
MNEDTNSFCFIDDLGNIHKRKIKTGVVLLNIGSATSEDNALQYLINMFTDKDIIQLPCQSILGRLIPLFIYNKSIMKHRLIGGFSHVPYWTNIQAKMLQQYLDYHSPETAPHIVLQCQRYSEPRSDQVVQDLIKLGVEFCVAIPLFPQYSVTSTLSSLRDLDRALDTYDCHGRIKWSVIQSFNSHPSYLKLIANSIISKLEEFPKEERDQVNIIFSAHSLPLSIIKKGDIYQHEIKRNIQKIISLLRLPNPMYLGWQSQEGKRWLVPKTEDVIRDISYKEGYGNANILVFPLSFVSDHIETLYDIDILQSNAATEYGIKYFKRCESFNDDPRFIETLGDIFMEHIKKINCEIKIENEDEIDAILNLALVDNNIKRYIDGPIDGRRKKQRLEQLQLQNKNSNSIILFKMSTLFVLISLMVIISTMFYLSKDFVRQLN